MKYIFILIFSLFSYSIYAQEYTKAFGLRTGNNSAFTYKSFFNDMESFEGMLSFKQGIIISVLKEQNELAFVNFSDRIFYYYGFGGHIGFVNNSTDNSAFYTISKNFRQNLTHPVVGLDVLVGIEYRFVSVPFIAGLEVKPYFDLFGTNYFSMHTGDLSLTIKYIFN
ncbi:MAG: hypothetical protein GXO79_12385 [Chlorobi bacterium]|nr:hypothetical protein [Chlorobiota bacterium]